MGGLSQSLQVNNAALSKKSEEIDTEHDARNELMLLTLGILWRSLPV